MQSTSFEENEEVNFSWEKCKGIMTQVADRVLSNEHLRSVPTGWLDSECKRITTWKNKAYKRMLQRHRTRRVLEEYKEIRRPEKHLHKKKKREWLKQEL